jgi:Mat/Ecp fimbriae major subunit
MKKSIILSLAFLVSFNQAFAATTTGTANVKIVPVIVLNTGTQLNFGSIATTETAGTVVINATNSTGLGTNVTLVSVGATRTPGAFSVTSGEPNAPYTVVLPSVTVDLLDPAGNNITINNFNFIAGNGSRTLSGIGTDSFSVGATLNVGATQSPGTYTGTYEVTANY